MAMRMAGSVVPGQVEAEQQVYDRSKNAWLEVVWDDSTFDVIITTSLSDYRTYYHFWILAESMERGGMPHFRKACGHQMQLLASLVKQPRASLLPI